jgi:hypothetical protein
MPINKSKLDQLNSMMDEWFQARADKQARKDAKRARRDNENTDPVQFQEPPHKGPIAEPPEQYTDSLSKRRDLFR